jgi:hypothetical protein
MMPCAVNIVIFIEDEFTVIFATLGISGGAERRRLHAVVRSRFWGDLPG